MGKCTECGETGILHYPYKICTRCSLKFVAILDELDTIYQDKRDACRACTF